MDSFEISNEMVVLQPSVAQYGPDQSDDLLLMATVTAAVTICVLLWHKIGAFVNAPSLRLKLPILFVIAAMLTGCGYDNIVIGSRSTELRSYTSTVVVKSTTPLREAFGASPDVKKAWLVRAEYPGDESNMYQALHQLNLLLSSKNMAAFSSDDERAEFVKKCYEIVGFINVELVDPDKK